MGLDHDRDYAAFLFALDEAEHLAQLAYSHLARGEYQTAVDRYEELFALQTDVPLWAFFDTAQAYAALGQSGNALNYLRILAESGWTAVKMVEETSEFSNLHETVEWADLMTRMRRNQKG